MKARIIRFINAEAAVIPTLPGVTETSLPSVILSFGGEEGAIEDLAISVIDARQLALDTIASLANLGDPLAQAIGQQFFSGSGDEI